MSIKALKGIRVGSRTYGRGQTLDVSAAQARALLKAGLVEGEAPEERKAPAEDLSKLTNKQLHEIAAVEGIAVETDDNKASLVAKIEAGRAAKA